MTTEHRDCWVLVHPKRGPDWNNINYNDEMPGFCWIDYEWKRCVVTISYADEAHLERTKALG